jgi:hypothetical protein
MELRYIVLFSLILGCGRVKELPEPSDDQRVTDEQKEELRDLRNTTLAWVQVCSEGIACGEDGDGDSMLWAGLLCAGGDVEQCETAKLSFGNDGSVRRAPGRLYQDVNASSRDMLLGALHYIVATKDTVTAKKMLKSIKDNGYKLCTNATDNRCDLSPTLYSAMWGTMMRVWEYIGLEPSAEMLLGVPASESLLKIQAIYSGSGYTTHLVAVNLFLHQKASHWTIEMGKAARYVSDKQPKNPFYEYIRRGATKKAAETVLDLCPTERPERYHQWAWQRDTAERAWEDSMGWDCIFMANILLKD